MEILFIILYLAAGALVAHRTAKEIPPDWVGDPYGTHRRNLLVEIALLWPIFVLLDAIRER